MVQNFFFNNEIEGKVVGEGVTRKILAYSKELMICEIEFEEGSVGALHEHFHEQCTYIISGKFEFEVDGVKKIISAGDSTYKQPHIIHGAVCLEKGKLLDVFTPGREDFLA